MPARIISKSQVYENAFLFDETIIKRVNDFVSQNNGKIRITVECSDNSKFNTDSIDELISYANTSKRQITHVSFSSTLSIEEKDDISFRLWFSSQKYISSIRQEISGNEKSAFYVFDALEEIIISARQWFWPIRRLDFFLVGVYLLFGLIIFSLFYTLYRYTAGQINLDEPVVTTYRSTLNQFVAILIIVGMPFIGWLLDLVIGFLFPKATFAIGDGIKRMKNLGYFRSTVIGGILISVMAGIILNLF